MKRVITSLTVALTFACGIALQAQDATIKTQTKVEADDAKTVKYTGCLATGTETQSFVLSNVMPVGQTSRTVTGTSGPVTTTTTTYALIPGEKVEFTKMVGHKVEVTGVLMSGDMTTTTKTTIDRDNGKDTTVKDKTKVDDAMPQLRVTAVKHLADTCTP